MKLAGLDLPIIVGIGQSNELLILHKLQYNKTYMKTKIKNNKMSKSY